jgi:hypothetical protein
VATSTSLLGSFAYRKARHGTDGFTSPPKEGVLRIFSPENPTASAGFEPTNLGTKGQHATSRPPNPRFLALEKKIMSESALLKTLHILYMSPAKIILMYMKRYVVPLNVFFSAGRHLLLTGIFVRSRVSAGAFTLLLYFFFLLVRLSENMFSPKTQVSVKHL